MDGLGIYLSFVTQLASISASLVDKPPKAENVETSVPGKKPVTPANATKDAAMSQAPKVVEQSENKQG
jgi:hypothetical protein